MQFRILKKFFPFLLFLTILFSSCSKVTKPENCIDMSESFYYLNVGTEPGTIEQVQSRQNEFQKLEEWCHCNISDIAGISGNYVWIKADFELPPNLPSDDISLFISYIHFAEKTYLNGELIGECGVFPDANGKGERSAMYRTHFYRLNKNLLNEAGKNTIYIQIYSKGHAESSGYCYIGPTDVLTELSTFNLFWSSRFYLLICASPFITFVLFFVLFITRRKNKDWNNYFFAMENIFTIGMISYFFAGEVPMYVNWGISHIWYTKIMLCACTCLVIHFVSLFTIHYINGEIPKRINTIQAVLLIIIILAIFCMPDFTTLMNSTWPLAFIALIKFGIGFYYPIRGLKIKEQRRKSIIFLLAFTPFYISIIMFTILNYIIDYSLVAYYPIIGHQLSNFVFIIILCKDMNRTIEENNYLNENLEREIQIQTVDITFANERLEQELKRAEQDLEMASVVQQNFLLPEDAQLEGWDIAILYEPLAKVSGDLYDYYCDGNKLLGFSLFDVSGHGIAASLVTMLSKNIIFKRFKSSLKSKESVSHTMMKINDSIIKSKGNIENYLTGLLFHIVEENDESVHIQMARGGHPYPVWYSAESDNIELFQTDSSEEQIGAIGINGIEVSYPNIDFDMKKGDVLVAFTDGLNESCNDNHEQFGRERIELLVKENHNLSANEIKEKLINALNDFIGDVQRNDDITMIVLKKE